MGHMYSKNHYEYAEDIWKIICSKYYAKGYFSIYGEEIILIDIKKVQDNINMYFIIDILNKKYLKNTDYRIDLKLLSFSTIPFLQYQIKIYRRQGHWVNEKIIPIEQIINGKCKQHKYVYWWD